VPRVAATKSETEWYEDWDDNVLERTYARAVMELEALERRLRVHRGAMQRLKAEIVRRQVRQEGI